jgi:hypothetical protein
MTNWQHTLDIKDAWEKAENNQITTAELAGVIAEQLKTLPSDLPDASAHADEFAELAKQEDLSEDDFNSTFHELYEWADENKVWIATFG